MQNRLILFFTFLSVFISGADLWAQVNGKLTATTTAVPFLMVSPDARTGALGDAGVALPDNLNAIHWNAALLPFNEKRGALSLSYTPWLRSLVPDVSLSYLTAYAKINDRSAVAGSLRYFSLGEIQFTDIQGNPLGNFTPSELAADVAYSQKLSDKFAVGIAFRYIYSNLAGGFNQSSNPIRPGIAFAGDASCYYKDDAVVQKYKVNYGFGAAITNIGSKITYTNAQFANFIPINLRIGGYGRVDIDKYNTIALLLDLSKLMVPSNPDYATDPNGRYITDANGNKLIATGMNPDVPVIQGMFQSFYDAPGGFSQELKQIDISTGVEYWYDRQFALRTGYFYENAMNGNRKYMTMGLGIKYNVFGLDAAYLVSFGQRNPLDQTIRFTLTFDFESFKNGETRPGDVNTLFDVPAN